VCALMAMDGWMVVGGLVHLRVCLLLLLNAFFVCHCVCVYMLCESSRQVHYGCHSSRKRVVVYHCGPPHHR
jgi:hypothetical protein